MSGWRRVAGGLADCLWPAPEPCPACGRPVRPPSGPGGIRLCAGCLSRLPFLVPPLCRSCGKPLRLAAAGRAECPDCAGRPRSFRVARAAGLYEGELRRLIHRLKFRRERPLAFPLGQLLAATWRRHRELWEATRLVPVPLAPDRLAGRGFNQAQALAEVLGASVRRPVCLEALVRQGGGGVQSLRSEAQRGGVAEGVFRPFRPAGVAGQAVLLVDDVLTTGATAEACAVALLRAGARSVDVLTVATTVVTDRWRAAREGC